MKHSISFLIIIIIFISCKNGPENKKSAENQKNEKMEQKKLQRNEENEWINSFPSKIQNIKSSFKRIDVGKYNCSIIDEFYVDYGTKVDTKDLIQIDSILCLNLFGNANSDYGTFCDSYLYSIEKPFLGFFPITVIQYFGVVERPLMLVLFDSVGNYVNSIEVADSYGETGGCLSSKFINDSTINQEFEWYEYGEDSLGNEIWETTHKTQSVVFRTNGEFEITELNNQSNN